MRKKKNEFVFTIGFKEKDPEHVRVVKMLNEMDTKNQFIVDAILCYVDSGYQNLRPWNILGPAVRANDTERPAPPEEGSPASSDAEPDKNWDMEDDDINGIMQSLQAFRG